MHSGSARDTQITSMLLKVITNYVGCIAVPEVVHVVASCGNVTVMVDLVPGRGAGIKVGTGVWLPFKRDQVDIVKMTAHLKDPDGHKLCESHTYRVDWTREIYHVVDRSAPARGVPVVGTAHVGSVF